MSLQDEEPFVLLKKATASAASTTDSVQSTTSSTDAVEARLRRFGLLSPTSVCKLVRPQQGLMLGNRPITVDELLALDPDELDDILTRNGNPLSIGELAELLDLPEELVSMIEDVDLADVPDEEEEDLYA